MSIFDLTWSSYIGQVNLWLSLDLPLGVFITYALSTTNWANMLTPEILQTASEQCHTRTIICIYETNFKLLVFEKKLRKPC